ncbi:SMEK domain-containing protein [Citrobacter portucalensis]|uniref:SMEK domain-containing protein n=1 Tax=Citrobacter portucalensis TaxID=1639133 RepID=UPI0031403C98
MLDRQIQLDKLSHAFSWLSTDISLKNKISLTDINKVMEDVIMPVIGATYKYNLKNLNVEKYNHPAIDLGDPLKQFAVQVTSDGSKSKMEDTVDMFIKHNLDQTYKTLWFLVISNDPKVNYQRQGFNLKVMNLGDLLQGIANLPQVELDAVYNYCTANLSYYMNGNNPSLLAAKTAMSSDPAISIQGFLTANNIDLNDGYTTATEADIRNILIDLKNILASLNNDERWFIYHVMEYSMTYEDKPETCMAPFDAINQKVGQQNLQYLFSVVNSVDSKRLGRYEENHWKMDGPGYMVYFRKGKYEEFDYFAGITQYLKFYNKKALLEEVIVKCDFSIIT